MIDNTALETTTTLTKMPMFILWHEASYKDLDLDQLQRGQYLDMSNSPAANGETWM